MFITNVGRVVKNRFINRDFLTLKTSKLNTDCTIFFTHFYFDMIFRNLLPFLTSLSGNQFINLPVTTQHESWCTGLHTRTLTDLNCCPDTQSEYPLRTSSHSSLGLSQEISSETFWQIFLGIFWYFEVGSLFLGNLFALHRNHFITMKTLADMIVYQAVFSNLLFLWNLSILLDLFNLALVISLNVSLLSISDLLHQYMS